MKRKIKFRVWDKEQKRILSHELIDEYDKDGLVLWGDILSGKDKTVELMQYTGLKDKSGREIYEGDIYKRKLDKAARFRDSGSENWCDYWLIHWIEKSSCFTTTCIADYDSNTGKMIKKRSNVNPYSKRFDEMDEYIGNIYENPELLNY